MKTNMAAASYQQRILSPRYRQTSNVKPLTANRSFSFAVKWPNLNPKVSIILIWPPSDYNEYFRSNVHAVFTPRLDSYLLPVNSHMLKFVSLCNDLRNNLLSNHADDTWLTFVIIALYHH